MSKGVTFYFVRHGETYFNFYGRMQGWADALLTENGIMDVQRSGRGLADTKFDAVYTSDLRRTIDTAEILLAENNYNDGLEIIPLQEFREVSFGSFEGLQAKDVWEAAYDEVTLKHGLPKGTEVEIKDILDTMKEMDPYHHAENYKDFWMRVKAGLLILLNRHAGTNQNILVVCHGLTIRNLLHGLVHDFNQTEPLKNASVSMTKYSNGHFQLLNYNQTDHFK